MTEMGIISSSERTIFPLLDSKMFLFLLNITNFSKIPKKYLFFSDNQLTKTVNSAILTYSMKERQEVCKWS